jgi:hypothetical protein
MVVAILSGAGGVVWAAGPGSAPPAATRVTSAVPPFAIFGWGSPPPGSMTADRMAEMAGAGFNVVLPAIGDLGHYADNLNRLDLAAAHGMRCLIMDTRMGTVLLQTDWGRAMLDAVVSSYKSHPGFLGYYLGDEPPLNTFGSIQPLFAAIQARDPEHPPWHNLIGRQWFGTHQDWASYTSAYLDQFNPAILCNDEYDFQPLGDVRLFIDNAAGLGALSRQHGIPFWAIVLLVKHSGYRSPTEGELKWQVSNLLAYGARGIGYFTYWTPYPDAAMNWQPAVIGFDGKRTAWYDVLAAWNPQVMAAGEALASQTWLLTVHAGSVPVGGMAFTPDPWVQSVEGRAALGYFSDASGRFHLLVANSDSLGAQSVNIELPGLHSVDRMVGAQGLFSPLPVTELSDRTRVTVDLEAGGFALLRIGGFYPPGPTPGTGPALRFAPDPAHGEVRFSITGLGADARLEILDVTGRQIWSQALASGNALAAWRGESTTGGTAVPGLYFVRVRDGRGVTSARLSWLGH